MRNEKKSEVIFALGRLFSVLSSATFFVRFSLYVYIISLLFCSSLPLESGESEDGDVVPSEIPSNERKRSSGERQRQERRRRRAANIFTDNYVTDVQNNGRPKSIMRKISDT